MSKKKPIEEAPAHIVEWVAANPFAAADDIADQVRQDARADVAMGRPIEDAQLIARGLKEEDKASRAGKASGEARSGVDSKEAFILAEAARYRGPPEAMVNTIVKRYAAFTKHKKSVSARHVRGVLGKK